MIPNKRTLEAGELRGTIRFILKIYLKTKKTTKDETRQEQLNMLLQRNGIAERLKTVFFYKSYDDFIVNVPNSTCNAVIIAHKGALGMQGARAAKILLHRVPIVWFSDDCGFVEESYRIGCVYFSPDTITENLLTTALKRCENERSS